MLTIVIATNVFIQCRPLHELPWSDLCGGEAYSLAVTPAVMREIDHLKQDGKPRRSKRARLAAKILSACNPTDARTTLPNGIQLAARFDLMSAWEQEPFTRLDRALPDDQLIADALTLSRLGERVLLLCGDTMPRFRAKQFGLEAMDIPDSWLLPPETDDRDKELNELREFKKATERQRPKPFVELLGTTNGGILQVDIAQYRSVPAPWAESRIADYLRRNPPAFNNKGNELSVLVGSASLSETQLKEYVEAYARFETQVRRYFSTSLHAERNEVARLVQLKIRIGNSGEIPAERFRLGLQARDGAKFYESGVPEFSYQPPRAPKPPQATDLLFAQNHLRAPIFNMPHIRSAAALRDPETMVWDEEPSKHNGRDYLELQCALLRHGAFTHTRTLAMALPDDKTEMHLIASISCTNLPQSVTTKFIINAAVQEYEIPEIQA
jgi:hypothetical protein